MIYYKNLGEEGHGMLANQLFEIATTISLAIDNNDIALFPPWKYNKYLKNGGILTNDKRFFNITVEHSQPQFEYKKIPYTEGMNLNDYFQSEKYFSNNKDKIRKIFTLKEEYENDLKQRWKEQLMNSVSIHVRRGDYLDNQSFHPCPPLYYFKKSLKYIESFYKIENILVFSDDILWCKDNFKDDRCHFVEGQNEIEDLFLMSYCDHNIVTNSSFSWWGSWLNKNENKIVCFPSQWFGDGWNMNWNDIYYDGIKIIDYNDKSQKICVFSVCYNEEEMMPFYLDYYINFLKVDKIVIYDGGSTDKTHEIIKKYPQVDLIIEKQEGQNDVYLRQTKNNCWKKYKNEYDWVIVCDIDEFLYHPNIHNLLYEYKNNNINIPRTKGYEMISLDFPTFSPGKYLPDIVNRGFSDNVWMGKKIIFDPQINEINYDFGGHDCSPTGYIKYSDDYELFMLHYKWMSHNYLTSRCKFLDSRRSQWNIEHKAGDHWIPFSKTTKEEYEEKYKNSIQVLKMKHFYETIDGWFDFKEFYSSIVNKFSSGSHFIEIGAWLGKSSSYMTVEIINSGKDIQFDIIDTWEGSKDFIDEDAYKIDGDPYEIFLKNLSIIKQKITFQIY